MGVLKEINSADSLRRIVQRLPFHLRTKFVEVADSIQQSGQRANISHINEGVVSKETVELRRWGSSIQKFGFINGVDNVNWPPYKILKADVSSVSPSSERIEGLWVTCSFYSRVGATLLVVTWQREK